MKPRARLGFNESWQKRAEVPAQPPVIVQPNVRSPLERSSVYQLCVYRTTVRSPWLPNILFLNKVPLPTLGPHPRILAYLIRPTVCSSMCGGALALDYAHFLSNPSPAQLVTKACVTAYPDL